MELAKKEEKSPPIPKGDPFGDVSRFNQNWNVVEWMYSAEFGSTRLCTTGKTPKKPSKLMEFFAKLIGKTPKGTLIDELKKKWGEKKILIENNSSLRMLGDDILLATLSYATHNSILLLSSTSRFFYIFCNQDRLWKAKYYNSFEELCVPHITSEDTLAIERIPLSDLDFTGRWKQELLLRNRCAPKLHKRISTNEVYVNITESITLRYDLESNEQIDVLQRVILHLEFKVDQSFYPLKFTVGAKITSQPFGNGTEDIILHPIATYNKMVDRFSYYAFQAVDPGWRAFEFLQLTSKSGSNIPLPRITISEDGKTIILSIENNHNFTFIIPIHENNIPRVEFRPNIKLGTSVKIEGNKLSIRYTTSRYQTIFLSSVSIHFSEPYGWRYDEDAEINMIVYRKIFYPFRMSYLACRSVSLQKWFRYSSNASFKYILPSGSKT